MDTSTNMSAPERIARRSETRRSEESENGEVELYVSGSRDRRSEWRVRWETPAPVSSPKAPPKREIP